MKNTILTIFCFLLVLTSCSSKKQNIEKEATEIKSLSIQSIKDREEVLFEDAQIHFEKGVYTIALQAYQKLITSYPLGAYQEYAKIKIADCYFNLNQFQRSAQQYASFRKDHPASNSYTYATYRNAKSLELSQKGVGRDYSPLTRSLEIYEQIYKKSPSSPFGKNAKKDIENIQRRLTEAKIEIASFYQKLGYNEAYEKRASEMEQDKENTSSSKPEITTIKPIR